MLRTKLLITDITEVPREWIFEHYLQLQEKLTGQDVKIKSVFNKNDRTPSMCIYYASNNTYKYKDFSTGKSGDAINLIMELTEPKLTTRGETAHKIIEDYNTFILNNKDDGIRQFKKKSKYKVVDFTIRSWSNFDEKYWNKFHIGSKLLEFYKVAPLSQYKLSKEEEDGSLTEQVIKSTNMYGYFRKDGVLYKIYHPLVKDYKFIKVQDYIQGMDQLTMKVPYLVICSSLKDVMAFSKLGYKNAEAIAPDSENTMIPEHVIMALKHKYKAICTLFDNDAPGIESMKKYKEKYNLPYVVLEMSKDLSDSVRDTTLTKVRETLTPLLKDKLMHQETLKKEDYTHA
jgi:hypothetical protein